MSEKLEPMQPRYYRSPVDYEAWRNGYMPPSEHVLIDALHRGEAKVISSIRLVGEIGWWFVMENPDKGVSAKKAEMIKELLKMDLETLTERFDDVLAKKTAQHEQPKPDEEPSASDA